MINLHSALWLMIFVFLIPYYIEKMIKKTKESYELIMEIPSFMKGMSVIDTVMVVDECEDLSLKQVKMLGTRIGKNSCIVFTGDYHQAEKKYRVDSGMSKMIECMKGDPLVGIVVLEEDVRSSVSKLFANLDN